MEDEGLAVEVQADICCEAGKGRSGDTPLQDWLDLGQQATDVGDAQQPLVGGIGHTAQTAPGLHQRGELGPIQLDLTARLLFEDAKGSHRYLVARDGALDYFGIAAPRACLARADVPHDLAVTPVDDHTHGVSQPFDGVAPFRLVAQGVDLHLRHRLVVQLRESWHVTDKRRPQIVAPGSIRRLIGDAPGRQPVEGSQIETVVVTVLTVIIGDTLDDAQVEPALAHHVVKAPHLSPYQAPTTIRAVGAHRFQLRYVERNILIAAPSGDEACGGDHRVIPLVFHEEIIIVGHMRMVTQHERTRRRGDRLRDRADEGSICFGVALVPHGAQDQVLSQCLSIAGQRQQPPRTCCQDGATGVDQQGEQQVGEDLSSFESAEHDPLHKVLLQEQE